MEGGQVVAGLKYGHDFGSKQYALVELLPAMYHAVAYGIQFVEALKHGVFACSEHFEDKLHACSVFLDGTVNLDLLSVVLQFEE